MAETRNFMDSFPPGFNWPLKIEKEFGQYPAVKTYLDAKFSKENDDAKSVYKRLNDFHNIPKNSLSTEIIEEVLKGLSLKEVWPPFFKSQWQPAPGRQIENNFLQCASIAGNFKLIQWWVTNGYVSPTRVNSSYEGLSTAFERKLIKLNEELKSTEEKLALAQKKLLVAEKQLASKGALSQFSLLRPQDAKISETENMLENLDPEEDGFIMVKTMS